MEIRNLIEEIAEIEHRIKRADHVIELNEKHSMTWIVSASNNSAYSAFADGEFLIDAVKSQRQVYTERLEKLREAVRVVEKVIDGIVA